MSKMYCKIKMQNLMVLQYILQQFCTPQNNLLPEVMWVPLLRLLVVPSKRKRQQQRLTCQTRARVKAARWETTVSIEQVAVSVPVAKQYGDQRAYRDWQKLEKGVPAYVFRNVTRAFT